MNTLMERPPQISGAAEAQFERRMERVMTAVDLHHAHLLDYLFQLTRHRQDSEDLAQELWRYVLHNFPEEKITALSLLRRKAYQLFVDHYRAAKRRPEVPLEEVHDRPVYVSREAAFSDAEEGRMKTSFWLEFHGIDLTEAQKEVLWLHGRYGFTYQEIAAQTGVPSSTVGDWIALGRERLMNYLNQNQ